MDNQDTLNAAIIVALPQILSKFTLEEFLVFRNAHEDDIICGSAIREWVRNELIGEDGPLLRAFIECRYSDRDDMTEYILQEFKDYVDSGSVFRNQITFYTFAEPDGKRYSLPFVDSKVEKI